MENTNSSEPYRSGADSYNYGCMDSIDDFFSYAENYKKAGDILVEWVETQKGLADRVIHPLCFLYRQYIELALKSIIVDGHQLLGKSEKLDFTHDIPKLWDTCKMVINDIYGNNFSNAISEIDQKIQIFLSVSPSHEAFRYPISKKQASYFSKQHYVNVRVLREEINEIWQFFFGISNDMAERMRV
ncbi:MAG: hypothetical protein AB7T38_00615 [Nitrospirales bacterium]